MTSHRTSASTALPPAFTSRERAALEAYFGKSARAKPVEDRSSFIVAAAVVAIVIGLLFTMHGAAHADRLPGGTTVAFLDRAVR